MAKFLVDRYGFKQIYIAQIGSASRNATFTFDVNNKGTDASYFSDAEALIDFVTKRWQERWVTTDVWDEAILEVLRRRPFFILVSVDAPVSLRWRRFKQRYHFTFFLLDGGSKRYRCEDNKEESPSLEDFVLRNDDHLYHPCSGLARLIDHAEVRLVNTNSSLESLNISLNILDLANEQRLRPSWDQYFMQLASFAAQRSNCMKRRVGCVLIRERRIISTGYNGTPRGIRNCNEGGCESRPHLIRVTYSLTHDKVQDVMTDMDPVLVLRLVSAFMQRRMLCSKLGGSGFRTVQHCIAIRRYHRSVQTLPLTLRATQSCPCLTCSIKIAQVGISEVVYNQGYSMDTEVSKLLISALGVIRLTLVDSSCFQRKWSSSATICTRSCSHRCLRFNT